VQAEDHSIELSEGISLRNLCVLRASAVNLSVQTIKPQRRKERRGNAEMN